MIFLLEQKVDEKLGQVQLVYPKYLSLSNRSSSDVIQLGGEIVYGVEVRNGGPSGVSGAVLTNTFSGPFTVVEMSSTQGTCAQAGQAITCNRGDIGKGGLVTVALRVHPTAPGLFSNLAAVRANEPDEGPLDNKSEEVTVVQ